MSYTIEKIREFTNGKMADQLMECSGNPEVFGTLNKYVKDGGVLVYSTCTIEQIENEGVTERFLENHPEFTLLKEKQMIPGVDGGDGFYIAMLQKEKHE